MHTELPVHYARRVGFILTNVIAIVPDLSVDAAAAFPRILLTAEMAEKGIRTGPGRRSAF